MDVSIIVIGDELLKYLENNFCKIDSTPYARVQL